MDELKDYAPSRFMEPTSHYDKRAADLVVAFIGQLSHTKGSFYNTRFRLLPGQERIVRDLFGTLKPDGTRQFTTAYIEVPKKQGKSELAAAIALIMALDRAMRGGGAPAESVYDSRGLLFV